MFLRRKSSKRNPKPFRRFDDEGLSSSLGTFEKVMMFILAILLCIILYNIIAVVMI